LSRLRTLFVIARNSAFTYKGKAIDVRQVGRELGVKYIIEGSVRKAGDRIRITAQLIDAESGAHVWGEKYDRPMDDIFEIQDEIVGNIAASIQTEVLLHDDPGSRHEQRPDVTAWELVKKAWIAGYGLGRESQEAAIALAREAVARAPESSLGYEVLACALLHSAYMGSACDPAELAHEALVSVQNALKRDGRSEYAHWTHGGILGYLYGQHEQACAALRQSIELNPNFSLAYGTLGTILVLAGKPDDGIVNIERAIRLNPRDPSISFRYSGLSLAYLVKRQLSAALEWAERSASRNPDWWLAHALIAAIQTMQGRAESAGIALDDLRRVVPDATLSTLPWRRFLPPTQLETVHAALRKAGLPE
jgi:adenylate cyclase